MTRLLAPRVLWPLLLLLLAVVLRIADPPVLEEFRLRVFDNYQRLAPRAYVPAPVVVLDIDDETLSRFGQWPWPRTLVAHMIDQTFVAGAAVVALDIVFAEPDRTSPNRILESLGDPEILRAVQARMEKGELLDHDQILAEMLASGPTVTGFVLTGGEGTTKPVIKTGLATAGDDPAYHLLNYPGVVTNLPELEAASAGNGSLNAIVDSDGVVRRVPIVIGYQDGTYPSLTAEALRLAVGASTMIVKASGASGQTAFGEQTGIVEVKIGPFVIPTDRQGNIVLRDTGPIPERSVPAWTLLDPASPAPDIEGKIVFIGTSAAGLKDQHSSPLDPTTAGVTLHAQALEQVLTESYLERPDWAAGAEISFITALGIAIIVLFAVPKVGTLAATALSVVAIGGSVVLSWQAYTGQAMLFDPVYPSIVGVMVYSGTSLLRFVNTETERRRIRTAFGRYMAPALVERLAEDPGHLKLGGEMRELTLLFCDIRGFTSISERLDAEELTALINRFLTPMTDLILEREGTIDKYMGDCIMAFWNAPLDVEDHRGHGLRSALAMRRRLVTLNADLALEAATSGEEPIELGIGIGLNAGIACVGNMGSDQRFDYSALGDTVNLASRLEGQCKTYGVEIVVSKETLDNTEAFAALELDLITVKGKTEPIRVFTVIGEPEVAETAEFKALAAKHAAMIIAYRGQQWDTARTLVAECRPLAEPYKIPGLYDLYDERLDQFELEPPPADWDGVFVATSK